MKILTKFYLTFIPLVLPIMSMETIVEEQSEDLEAASQSEKINSEKINSTLQIIDNTLDTTAITKIETFVHFDLDDSDISTDEFTLLYHLTCKNFEKFFKTCQSLFKKEEYTICPRTDLPYWNDKIFLYISKFDRRNQTYMLHKIIPMISFDIPTNVTIQIPGRIDLKQTRISNHAFFTLLNCNEYAAKNLTLAVKFINNGQPVCLPKECDSLFENKLYKRGISLDMQNSLSLIEIDFSGIDTKIKYTGMSRMFYGCCLLQKLDLSNFDTSEVTNMSEMFRNCISLKKLTISNFNTSNVQSMEAMFMNCQNIEELNISNFSTSKVEDISRMFENCYSLKEINLSNFDTTSVQCMSNMFACCSTITNLDLSNFSFDYVDLNGMDYMFYNCDKLKHINMANLKSNRINNGTIFDRCTSLETVKYKDQEMSFASDDTQNDISIKDISINILFQ